MTASAWNPVRTACAIARLRSPRRTAELFPVKEARPWLGPTFEQPKLLVIDQTNCSSHVNRPARTVGKRQKEEATWRPEHTKARR